MWSKNKSLGNYTARLGYEVKMEEEKEGQQRWWWKSNWKLQCSLKARISNNLIRSSLKTFAIRGPGMVQEGASYAKTTRKAYIIDCPFTKKVCLEALSLTNRRKKVRGKHL